MNQEHDIVEAQQKINLMLESKKSITLLLVGRTGVGKSSTINSLLGASVAPVGKFKPTTMSVASYLHQHGGLQYRVVDTPGLCDDLPEAGNDQRYLAAMRETSGPVDCLLFVTELDATRVSSDERRGIRMLTDAFGASIWENALIIFTRADKVGADDFESDLKERTGLIREVIAAYAPLHATYVPPVAVSNTSDKLPNGRAWLGELFTQILMRLRHDATVPFLHSMRQDVGIDRPKAETKPSSRAEDPEGETKQTRSGAGPEKPRIDLNKEQQEKVKKTVWDRILNGAAAGATLGAKIGKPLGKFGEAIGAAVGAIGGGLLGWLF